ncbi:hypothetical protein [Saccharopolyspora sp. ASAGF58]|uniref:hypothetical protein n=1 Tax=Saccharopolyspora sp. ASAGF58 TaxID=2719023 RepID=UPI0014400D5B|nr:hypothetical protein [Saccharopolyspora sp. ASAGF58]QIZ37826.1 hypothetical protein FDZ84_28685 [Saccharopolyspora sp. ASAGF58]
MSVADLQELQEWQCPTCRNWVTGAHWGNRSECLGCHERALLPIPPDGVEETGESWADVYVGGDDW